MSRCDFCLKDYGNQRLSMCRGCRNEYIEITQENERLKERIAELEARITIGDDMKTIIKKEQEAAICDEIL